MSNLIERLKDLLLGDPPPPSYLNVIPEGRGWYRYSRGKWRRCEARGLDVRARWLSDNRLLEFVLDAVIAVKGKQGK